MENPMMEGAGGGEQAQSAVTAQKNPIWQGVQVFFIDIGVSGIVGSVVGGIAGATMALNGANIEDIANSKVLLNGGMAIGLLVSIYAAYLLYKKYSTEVRALYGLIGVGVIFSLINLEMETLVFKAAVLAATIVAYVVGWYLAKDTNLRLFLLGRKLGIFFLVVGVLLVAGSILALFWKIGA